MSLELTKIMFNQLLRILWPIERHELKKFLPMALMMVCILFNYNCLRSLKDALVVPNIGAEVISFIKLYCVVPAAIALMLLYSKLTNVISQQKIFVYFALFFLIWFMVFAFLLYPKAVSIHPDPEMIAQLINHTLDFKVFQLNLLYFKWFFLIYSKWSFAVFYVLAELWGSAMLSLLFWQFANHITKTTEAKRFYPMFGFIGNIGLVIAGSLVKYLFALREESDVIASADVSDSFVGVQSLLSLMSGSVVLIIGIYYYIQRYVLTDPRYFVDADIKSTKPKDKLSLIESFKVIFSSKYLGHIAILLLAYGITINLVEGPWKAKVRELYPDTNNYAHFMGTLAQYTGIASMIAMIVGANILLRFNWFVGAIITPVVLCITGVGFFVFIVFYNDQVNGALSLIALNPLVLAVLFGFAQNVLSKATKYSFFDPTKEMSYIPIDNELKTKGKAAVDIVGARVAKSGGALIQSAIFLIFPAATFISISPYLMIIFIIVSLIWIVNVKLLYKEYTKFLVKSS
jgi:AAA family ATP:ADP antiporter